MTDKEEYGLEDICVALDAIEERIKQIIRIYKYELKRQLSPEQQMEIDQL